MTIIGSASIQIRADDKYFEPDVRRAVKKIKNVSIDLKADVDLTKASKKIRDLRYRITSKDAVLKIDADVTKAEEKMTRLLAKFINRELNLDVNANTSDAQAALSDLDSQIDGRGNRRADVTVDADTAVADRQLALLTRPRTATIRAKVDPATMAALQGLFNTVTGTLPFEKVKGVLTGVAANFEGIATKGTAVVSMLGALSAAALTTAANLFSVVGDVGKVIGLAALMPTAIGSMVAIVQANKMAWKGFGDAVSKEGKKGAEALAGLPPIAQEAALALRGTYTEIQKPVQNAFWDVMQDALQRTVRTLIPDLTSGLSNVSTSLAKVTVAALGSFEKLADGSMLNMLTNLGNGLANMAPGVGIFLDAMNTLGEVGSTYLPQFGAYLTNAASDFGKFITEAEKTGAIRGWINNGVQALQDLGSVAKDTVGIFNGLANASRMSGAASLTDMANGFSNIASIVNGEPFQSRLVSILAGARAGTDRLGEGLRTLTDLFSESSAGVGIFLAKAGEVAGLTFEGITALFDGTGLGSGLLEAMDGLADGLAILQPGFRDFGGVIGDLGEIAGELFRGMAPGLNMLAETVSGVVAGLKDGILQAMPVLNEFIQSILGLASGPIIAIAQGVGSLLEVFAGLPGPIQIAIAALVGFIALRPKIMGLWNGVRESATNAFRGMADDVDNAGTRSRTSFGQSADAIRSAWRGVGTALGQGSALGPYLSNMDRVREGAGAAARAIGTTAGQGLRMAGSGLMSALGGPWGAGLAVAGAAIALFAEQNAKAQAEIDGLAASLDQQTGAFTAASEKLILTDVLDLNATAWDDFARSGKRNMEELARDTGLNMQEVSDQLSNPEGRDNYVKNWQEIERTLDSGKTITDELAASVGMTAKQFEGLSRTDLGEMTTRIEKAAEMAEKAEAKVKALADAMGTNTIVAAQLAKNYDVLKSTTSGASEKFSALKDNIDLLSDGVGTARKASRDYEQALADQGGAIRTLVEENGGVIESTGRINDAFRGTLLNADKTFSSASQGARDFSIEMEKSADSILKQGTSALDAALKAGKSMPEAMASALETMRPSVDTLRGTLTNLGFDVETVNSIISQLGLDESKLTAAMSVDTSQAELDVARLKLSMASYADGNYTAVLAALPQSAKDALTETMNLGDSFATGDYTAVLTALDKTPGGLEAALASLLTFEGEDWTTYLKAQNLVPEEVAKANAAAAALIPEKSTILKADDLATTVIDSLNGYFLDDKTSRLNADDQFTSILAAVNGSPLNDKGSTLSTKDLVTQMLTEVNNKTLNNKLNALQTQDLVSGILQSVNQKSLNGKTSTLTASDLASMVVSAVNNMVIANKRFSITTEYLTSGNPVRGAGQVLQQANGGVISSSGYQKFANGGFSGINTKAFANGSEKHVAQIAKGAWPVRIWAEPETGGEAYIPLGQNKRKRSLEILRQVMAEFGLSSFAKFDNGGMMKSSKMTPSIVSQRYSGNAETRTATAVSGATVHPTVVNYTVNPSQGLSEEQIGQASMNELYWKLASR